MNYRVQVLPAAKRDLNTILRWIEECSRKGAASWFTRWNKALQSLAHMPTSHGFAPENDDSEREVRQLLFRTRRGRTYRALFTIRESDVVVMRIRGPGQDLLSPDELVFPAD